VARLRIISIQTTRERGGAEYANVDLLDALVARGHDVVLLTNLTDLVSGTDVRARDLDLGPKLGRRSAFKIVLLAPRNLLRVVRALRAEKPDALVVGFKKEQLLCSLLPRRLTGTVVWVEWGPLPSAMRRGPARLLYALAARRAHRILAVSEGTAATVLGAGVPSGKVIVMPDLVNLHQIGFSPSGRAALRRSWGVEDDTLVAGCIARFQKRKRNDVLVDSMAHVDGGVLLVMAGEGEQEQDLRGRSTGYEERVRFVPNVRGHVDAFLSACDLLAFAPSPTEADRPRVIAMAQLVGRPILATDPEGAEAVRRSGGGKIVFPHNDPRAFAAALREYRDDPDRCRREGELAHSALLAEYDPDQVLRTVEQALGGRG
jgi:glycosyltransferase involved in cell wall biosynthesis